MKIYLILLTALILRLINLNQSLWLDEAISVVNSQKYNFFDFATVYPLGDFHPPLYFVILWIWTRVFGISEIALRLPSVIFGVLTVWFTYLIGKKLSSVKTGLIAGAILAFNPLHIYYSQEARMYSLAAFSGAFSFWAFINLIKGKKYFLYFYGLSVVTILYSDYLVYFVLISQLVYVVWQEKKKMFKVLTGMFLGGILWFPWIFIFPSQLKTGQSAAVLIPGWANVVGGANLKELALVWIKSIIGRVSFENKLVYLSVVSFVSTIYGFVLFKAIRYLNKEVKLLLLWLVVPVLLAFLISFYIPVLTYFRMVFMLPGFSLLLAYGIEKFNNKNRKTLIGAVLIISSVFLLMYYLDPKFQREDWKGVMKMVNQKQATVLFEDSNIPSPASYYGCKNNCYPALRNFPAKVKSELNDLEKLTSHTSQVLLFNYLVEISDNRRLVAKELESLKYKLVNTYNFNGVGFVYEYAK